jgi:hypothetical protein
MPPHRGSQEFFAHIDEAQLWAYLFFRTADIYADAVTHIPPPVNQGVPITRILLDNSIETMTENRERFTTLLQLIRDQRAGKDPEWKTSLADCRAVMSEFGERVHRERLQENARNVAALTGTLLLAGLTAYLIYRTVRRS